MENTDSKDGKTIQVIKISESDFDTKEIKINPENEYIIVLRQDDFDTSE